MKKKKTKAGSEPVNQEIDLENAEDAENSESGVEQLEKDQEEVQVEVIEETGDAAENQIKELQDKLLRNMAEFDNFRKRTQKEKAGMYDMGVMDTLEKLLPVIDNFSRAMATLPADDEVAKGIGMIHRQFEEILTSIGLVPINCLDQPFDANLHSAVATGDETDKLSQTVLEELQRGYIYKEKVIRHSMVKVNN